MQHFATSAATLGTTPLALNVAWVQPQCVAADVRLIPSFTHERSLRYLRTHGDSGEYRAVRVSPLGLRFQSPHGFDSLGDVLFEGRYLSSVHGLELASDANVLLQLRQRVCPDYRAGDRL